MQRKRPSAKENLCSAGPDCEQKSWIEQRWKACQKSFEAMSKFKSSSLQKGMSSEHVIGVSAGQGEGSGGGLKVSTECEIYSFRAATGMLEELTGIKNLQVCFKRQTSHWC